MLQQNKNATAKHLQKLQQDVADWRKQSDETLRAKEVQIADLKKEVAILAAERDQLKTKLKTMRK